MKDVKPQTRLLYFERINRILNFINLNLDKPMDMDMLAGMGYYSTFHFQKIMRAHLGESLGSHIIRLRIETAAHLLKLTTIPVQDIAMKTGYENPASFNKAFKKRFGISPSEFREQKHTEYQHYLKQTKMNISDQISLQPKIKNIESMKVIYAQATGPYSQSAAKAWETVCSFAAKNKLFGFKTTFIGISHDSPDVTDAEKLRYDACITVKKDVSPQGEIGVKTIDGGKYAIFRHKGSYEKFNDSYNYIYGTWMPENNIEPDDKPCFELYINSPDKTKPEKLLTDIYIPIK
jgi:AraC family transcriptional regulator